MAASRERRANAGRKMAQLLATADHLMLLKEDEFYLNNYGGFNEERTDAEFDPPALSDSDDDVVDSDFDLTEEEEGEDEDDAVLEQEEKRKRRSIITKGSYREPAKSKARKGTVKSLLGQKGISKKKDEATTSRSSSASAASSSRKKTSKRNYVPLTQQQLMEEAKLTEKKNLESLKNTQEYEMELKKKQQQGAKRRHDIQGAKIKTVSLRMPKLEGDDFELEERTVVEFSDDKLFDDYFESLLLFPTTDEERKEDLRRRQKKRQAVCCISGEKARYKDPITGLYYADSQAFQQLRDAYELFLGENLVNCDGEQLLAVQNYLEWKKKSE